MDEQADFVIVGAGGAGCPGNRLTEDVNKRVVRLKQVQWIATR